jgi:hypothetical protein
MNKQIMTKESAKMVIGSNILMLEAEQLDDAVFIRSLFRRRRVCVLVFPVVLLKQCLHIARHPKRRVAHLAGGAEKR